VSIANPFLLCQRYISDTIYDNLILDILQSKLKTNYSAFKKVDSRYNIDVDKALISKSVKEYDECIVRKILGFKSADDYYRGISSVHSMVNIEVPLLCIHASDDQIATAKGIPYDEIKLNKNILLLETSDGGHICWLSSKWWIFGLHHWINEPAIDFICGVNKTIG